MIKPRNTLVLVELIEQGNKVIGNLSIPTNNDADAEGTVVAVGPGNVAAAGGISDTVDLKPGQRVLVKAWAMNPNRGRISTAISPVVDNGKRLYLFEQGQVMAILDPTPAALN